MLPTENRLKNSEEFRFVKLRGYSVGTNYLLISYFNRKDDKATRFGFVVTRKIDRRAVVRNRISRLMREAIRKNLDNIKKGYDVVLVARSDFETMNDCDREVARILKKAKLIS